MTAVPDDVALALQMADQADALTMDRFGAQDLNVATKPDLTPVTDADRSVETALRETLAQRRPDDPVLGEEFGGTTAFAGRQWVIDPIDGTKNFVRGVPVWATLIALLSDGVPVVGVVSAPGLQRRWWAGAGEGTFASFAGQPPRRVSVSSVADLESASLSFSSLSGWATLGQRDRFIELTDAVWRVRAYGDFLSYCLLAEGAVDIAAEPEVCCGTWRTRHRGAGGGRGVYQPRRHPRAARRQRGRHQRAAARSRSRQTYRRLSTPARPDPPAVKCTTTYSGVSSHTLLWSQLGVSALPTASEAADMTNTLPSESGSKSRLRRTGKASAVGTRKHKRTATDIGLALITPILGQEFLDRHHLRDPLNRSLSYGVKQVFSAAGASTRQFKRIQGLGKAPDPAQGQRRRLFRPRPPTRTRS